MNFVYIEDSRVSSLAVDLSNKISLSLDNGAAVSKIYVVGIGESGLSIAHRLGGLKSEVQHLVKQVRCQGWRNKNTDNFNPLSACA